MTSSILAADELEGVETDSGGAWNCLGEGLFRRMADRARDGITLARPDGRILYINGAIQELLGYSPQEYLADADLPRRLIHPDQRESFVRFWEELRGSGNCPKGFREWAWRHRDGHWMHFEHNYVGLEGVDGRLQAVLVTIRDVSARKEIERALRRSQEELWESEDRFRRMIENLPAGAILLQEGRLFLNQGAETLTGYERAEIPSLDVWFARVFPDRAEHVRRIYEIDKQAGFPGPRSVTLTRKDGAERLIEFSAVAEGASEVWLVRDVTEIDRLSRLLEQTAVTARVGGWELDCRTRSLFWTLETYRIHETTPRAYTPELASSIAFYAPESVPIISAAVRRGLEQGEGWDLELELITARGRHIWVLASGVAERENGRTVRVFGSFQDISERKRSEQERASLEQKLRDTQKLESLGVLAGGIAHDFNNLLTAILGNVSLLRQDCPPGSHAHSCLGPIEAASLRAADLCRQMLAYAGKGRCILQRVDLGDVVRDSATLMRLSLAKKADLELRLAPWLPPVVADRDQVRQILMTLFSNAAEALGDQGGTIVVATGMTHLAAASVRQGFHGVELPAGRYVYLEVADDGCGMTAETLARIFDPFFTTKFAGRGLGLAAVLGMVRGHGAALHVDSTVDKGARFTLYMPPATGFADSSDGTPTLANGWRGQGTVLVVDDEEGIRCVVARGLQTVGLTTLEAADGRAGLDRFRQQPDAVDLVVLDLTMPGVGGEEVLRQLRQLRPDLPVILMSGYSEEQVCSRLAGIPLSGYLQKPFRVSDLFNLVRTIPGLAKRAP